MKKYIQIVCCALLFAVTGCADWINVEPENSVTFENYFKTEKDAQALLFSLEVRLRDFASPFARATELYTDKNYADATGKYGYTSAYTFLDDVFANFEPYYKLIAAADLIIDNAFRFPLKEEVIRPYVLQAYFAKAYAYFKLATDFGEAPIIKDGQSFKKYGKSPVSEVLDEAEKWAELALEIPAYENLKLGDLALTKQFASKGAVTALLAKLYAWRAGVEGKTEYWAKAEEMCTQIIENKVGYYKLESSPEALCVSGLKGNSSESIWEIYRDVQELGGVFYHNSLGSIIRFPVNITSNIKDDQDFYVTKKTVREYYDENDLRKDAYFWETEADSVFIKWVNGETFPVTEYVESDSIVARYGNQEIEKAYFTKYRYPSYVYYDWSPAPNFRDMDQHVVKCRLADILLLRAECRVRQNKSNAAEDLNTVRRRAYWREREPGDSTPQFACDYPNADDVKKGLDKDLQLAIFREREKELLQEGHRYYDARRNGVEYVQRFFSDYSTLSETDIREGALYAGIVATAFSDNDLLRQNVYWNRRLQ